MPPGAGGPAWNYQPPAEHPQGVMILVFGLIGLLACFPLGIAAWVMGQRAINEIDASGVYYSNRGTIQAGRVCGIIGSVLGVLYIAYIVFIVVMIPMGL
ncbi:DUF4190 domain-containing protein [Ruania alkalisoli]|uniref:DUF4190 domain-containing protein n=2 Tax=Ruania alkalisoli TaxID=2779775 RepID=A0A7M1SYS3_9MICO|nr:DUF4190 domain-containing protein [Ruania alkalisoli]